MIELDPISLFDLINIFIKPPSSPIVNSLLAYLGLPD